MTTEAPTESQDKEAIQYWGYLLKDDKCGTELLNRLLTGLARHIVGIRLVILEIGVLPDRRAPTMKKAAVRT